MARPDSQKPLSDKVLDLVLGQLSAEEAGDLTSKAVGDPALAAERAQVERLLHAVHEAHALPLDEGAAARVSARVLRHVRDEEAAAAREAAVRSAARLGGRRAFWVRVVAYAVGANAAILGLLAFTSREPSSAPVEPFLVGQNYDTPPLEPLDPALTEPSFAPSPEPLVAAELLPLEDDPVLNEASMAPDVVVPGPSREASLLTFSGRAFWARTNDAQKGWLYARVGAPGSLATIRGSLAALAAHQRADGSFPAPQGASRSDVAEATALALLPFLGDGSSSRFGARQDVVEKGVESLRRGVSEAGREYVLWALSEDYVLSRAFLTPAETRDRAQEIRDVLARVAPHDASAVDRSTTLGHAVLAAARARFLAPPPAVVPAVAQVNAWLEADVRADTAIDVGTSILRRKDAEVFRRWSAKASVSLRAMLADDGLVRADATNESGAKGDKSLDAARVAQTARALLALQVPVRGE